MKPPLWKTIQRENFTSVKELLTFLELPSDDPRVLFKHPFVLNLPRRLAEKIEKGSWDDPILKQFLPLAEEDKEEPLYQLDPVDDQAFRKSPKLLHKYHARALLLSTSACAMNCRYCFRRHFPYETEHKGFIKELNEIRKQTELTEIILSGGDPLSLDNRHLQELFNSLNAIPHIERIRFHTRFPIGIPERIDDSFLKILSNSKQQIIFVIHTNHARELDDTVVARLQEVQKLGIPILSQSVLLKGVNDDADTLEALCKKLINAGAIPYYLHQLDRVQGAHHFNVPEDKGHKLIAELQRRLPGYAVPRYVQEVAHKPHKTPLTS